MQKRGRTVSEDARRCARRRAVDGGPLRVARGQRDDILLLLLLLLVALLLVALLRVALLLIRVHGAEAVRQMRRHVTRPRQKTSIDDMSRKDELDMRPRRKKKKRNPTLRRPRCGARHSFALQNMKFFVAATAIAAAAIGQVDAGTCFFQCAACGRPERAAASARSRAPLRRFPPCRPRANRFPPLRPPTPRRLL